MLLFPSCFVRAAVNWNLLDENCSDISDWTQQDAGTGVSEVNPVEQFRFAGGDAYAIRWREISGYPDTFTAEIKLYHDAIGTKADYTFFALSCKQADEFFCTRFASDGFFLRDTTDPGDIEVGTNLVKQGGNAEWQIWRFLVTFTGVTGDGTCDVYLDDSTHIWEKVGTAVPCSFVGAPSSSGMTYLRQDGTAIYTDMVTHIDYIKIAAGLYVPGETATSTPSLTNTPGSPTAVATPSLTNTPRPPTAVATPSLTNTPTLTPTLTVPLIKSQDKVRAFVAAK